MGILKKFKDYIKGDTLEEYLLENNDRYLQDIEDMKPGEGQIYILDRTVTNIGNSNRLFKIEAAGNLKNWRYFDDYQKDIFFIKDNNHTSVLQTKEVDNFKNTSILITKPVDLKIDEVKEAIQKNSGYIWLNIDELMFNTFNNYPKWGFAHLTHFQSSGMIVLEVFDHNIKSQIENNLTDKDEFNRYLNWVKEQLEIITNHPFKVFIDFKVDSNRSGLNGANIKFILDYPRL